MENGVRALPIEGSEGGIPDAARTPLRCFDRSIASGVSQCAKSACCRGYYRIKPEVELHYLHLSLTKFFIYERYIPAQPCPAGCSLAYFPLERGSAWLVPQKGAR